jgi:glycosyltransferase involved in cell wall biosynthesis
MSSKIPVSAVVITKNEQAHLKEVLRSVAICGEIVILDSGSTDRTREIAQARGVSWHEHPFDGYGRQKQRAVTLARHDWVFSVDADEVLDREAVADLVTIDWAGADPRNCWRVRRRTFVGLREIRHGHWKTDRPIRIFNRHVTGFNAVPVHESIQPTTRIRTLAGSLRHYSYADLTEVIRLDYHRLKAIRYRELGRRAGGAVLATRALWAVFHSYLLRGGFLEGGAGVVIALAAAVNATMGLAMASEPELVARPRPPRKLRSIEGRPLPKSA